MKLFDIDSPLIHVLNKVADLMWLNILTMVCCLPIFTAGASLTAMHYMALKIVRDEECYITRGFFKAFKENFKKATVIWLILLVVSALLIGDFYILNKSDIEFNKWVQMGITFVGILVVLTSTFVFPLLAKFENTIMGTIKNACMVGILQFPKAILMIVFALLPIAAMIFSWRLFPFVFLFGMSLPAFLSAMLYTKFFKKLEDKIEEANLPRDEEGNIIREEEASEDDERIFKDELDECLKVEEKQKKGLFVHID